MNIAEGYELDMQMAEDAVGHVIVEMFDFEYEFGVGDRTLRVVSFKWSA